MEQTQNNSGMPVAQPQSNSKKYWIIGGVIVILAITAFAISKRNATAPPQGIVVGDQNSLDIGDQDPDAVAVLVSQVSFITPGFIVIQDGKTGTPGAVLAVSNILAPGFYTNQTVIMRMQPGANYFGTLYGDDGNGLFGAGDINNDKPLIDPAGAVVRVPFKARMSSTPEDIKG